VSAPTTGVRPDERDFVDFFHEVEPALRRFAERIAPPGLDPEDLAAEGLARAYARWPRLRRLPYRRAWLFRVTANVALDGRRRSRTASRHGAGARPVSDATPGLSSTEDEVSRRATLCAALAALPHRQREAVALRYLGDLSLEEAAGAMSVSTETVKTHCERGLRELRRTLGPTFEERAR
jgi:RNA polymerase sigma factor (sigma-70 family)